LVLAFERKREEGAKIPRNSLAWGVTDFAATIAAAAAVSTVVVFIYLTSTYANLGHFILALLSETTSK
jgi:hypothetical protein